jgi:hypothetical protein
MADLLFDIEAFFVSKGVASIVYKDMAPDTPDNLIALYEYEGSTYIPQITGATRSVQFVVRDISATVAKTKARELYQSLVTEDGILNLTTERWCVIQLKQPPFRLKVDESGRVYYVFNASIKTYID